MFNFSYDKFFRTTLPTIILVMTLISFIFAKANSYMPMFIYDGVRYGVINTGTRTDVTSNINYDYICLGSTEHKLPFYFMLKNDFDGYKLPKGTKIYTTDKFFGDDEYRLFIVDGDNVYHCIPDIKLNTFFDKHLKQYVSK